MDDIKNILSHSVSLTTCQKDWTTSQIESQLTNFQVDHWGWTSTAFSNDEDEDDNLGVRVGGTQLEIELQADFEHNGWDSTQKPPVFDITTGKLLDGRTRKKNLRMLGVEYMPCVFGTLKDRSLPNSNARAQSFEANQHKFSKSHIDKDYIAAGIADHQDGELVFDRSNEESAKLVIKDHMIRQYKLHKKYVGGETNGKITEIAREIFDQTQSDAKLLVVRERVEWEHWVSASGITLSREDYVAMLQAGGNRPEQFWMRWVLPAWAKGKTPKVVLYANSSTVNGAREDVKSFVDQITDYYNLTYKGVNAAAMVEGENFPINKPSTKPWEILGVVPQVNDNRHHQMRQDHVLVPYKEFIK